MKVCITEKPSVAKDISQILGATRKCDGYYEGNGYQVTWTFGHLCTLKEPADYTDYWKSWSLGALPMIPPKFGIKLIPQRSYEHQFNIIKSLTNQADEIINCGDAGQEGELIQRWVMQKAGVRCDIKRLWISSLTDDAIREGFKALRPASDFDNLYFAGLSRAIGDWLLGMNATRLYSLKYSRPGQVLSVGRVQTPTLSMIVKRHFEIANFKPEDFWELKTVFKGAVFNATATKFKDSQRAQEALESIRCKEFVVKDVQEKKGREAPPRLFDLTSLQVECNKRFGWTADETLKLIQSLYEKKTTTYPRVDTTYLSEDIYPKIPDILGKMTPYANLTAPVLAARIQKSKKIFDNTKVTDHHAIIPTGQSPAALVGNERHLYHLIALRFIAAFYPDCVFNQTTVMGQSGDFEFKAIGKVISERGWRDVLDKNRNQQEENADDSDDRILPPFTIGETGPHEPSLQKKTTQPPKLFTEGTLLRAMESAGKNVDDETLREAMKENGIGRPSTRASIIETLFKRGYIARQRKSIIATKAGIELIETINDELLKSPKLTGIWENKLRKIERGQYSASAFIDELKTLISDIVLSVLNDNSMKRIEIEQNKADTSTNRKDNTSTGSATSAKSKTKRAPAVKSLEQIPCPVCQTGHILKGNTAYGCSRYKEGCTLRLPFNDYPDTLTPAKLKAAIKKNFK